MDTSIQHKLIEVLNEHIQPLDLIDNNYSLLLNSIGDARFVLIGEATHGTHEFYQARIEITKQLIEQKGFMAVIVEGDWPDAYCINRYVQKFGSIKTPQEALTTFKRFPTWMWRNQDVAQFLDWLHHFNESHKHKVGFYGLDLYSLHSSIEAVIKYLSQIDPAAAERARKRYACFDYKNLDPQEYGYLTTSGNKESCLKQSIEQILELQQHARDYIHQDDLPAAEEYFYVTQNARLIKNAEVYYRTMFKGHISSWNIRDQHMAETVTILADHLENRFNKPAKVIIWAHNSHIGDARATEMGEKGELNIGQLIREQHPNNTFLIGFSTYEGTVTAANNWDEAPKQKKVLPGLNGSFEALFHELKYKNFLMPLQNQKDLQHYLQFPRLQRAIGVIYRPETERESHYFFTRLPYQFDALIHFDKSSALQEL